MTPTEDELRRWREGAISDASVEAVIAEMWPHWHVWKRPSTLTVKRRIRKEMEQVIEASAFTRLIDAVETLKKENERLRRCLVPVTMHLAQLELERGHEAPDDMIVLYFMGSGASDRVTVKEIREALGVPAFESPK